MKFVTPRVYKVAETKLVDDNILAWLSDMDGQECLAHVTGKDGEKLIELAGRRCYKSFKPGLNPNVTKMRTDSSEYHNNVLKAQHGSILEHTSVSFALENVSRVVTHELVRHRAGTAMSQESLRYVRLTSISFWIPEIFKIQGEEKYKEALSIIRNTIEACENAQKDLAKLFDIENIKDFDTKKKLTSAFRRLAPDGLATGIVFTGNLRAWRHVIEMRTSRHAEEEFRLVAGQIANILRRDYPMIFQDYKEVEVDGLVEYTPEYRKV